MKSKKLLSVLLAALMVFSLGAFAFAEGDGGVLTPIPASAEGLNKGDYYLDFTPFVLPGSHWEDLTDEQKEYIKNEYLNAYAANEWRWDKDRFALEGMIPVEGGEYYLDINTGEGLAADFDKEVLTICLAQSGTKWVEVKMTADNLQKGDYYVDWDGFVDAYINAYISAQVAQYKTQHPGAGEAQIAAFKSSCEAVFTEDVKAALYNEYAVGFTTGDDNKKFYINTEESELFRMKVSSTEPIFTYEDNYPAYEIVYPLAPEVAATYENASPYSDMAESFAAIEAVLACVEQYDAPPIPGPGPGPDPDPVEPTLWQKIVAFFEKIINFFKNLFK